MTTLATRLQQARDLAMQHASSSSATKIVAFVQSDDFAALIEMVERVQWRAIESLPDGDEMIIARTDDGRVMVWRANILARNLRGPTPEHLQFPATHWTNIP